MKTKLLLFALVILSSAIYAQDNAKKKDSKAEKALQMEMAYRVTERMIDSTAFVLKAGFLSNRQGYRIMVEPLLNYIEVDSSQAVIQTGNASGIGYNGVGGLTVRGKITNWNVKKDLKHRSFMISMSVSSSLGFYDVFMHVNAVGKTSATLTGITSGALIFDGSLYPLKQSQTFEGRSL
jgi:hypothetical protein